jgi:parvulin-like peptidyl-prolyl isomerase
MQFSRTLFLALGAILALAFIAMPVDAARATASHILVKTEEQAQSLKDEIAAGAEFADLAKEHSTCPSGKRGGSLGSFTPGTCCV